jgi:hypothetical protein
MLVKAQRRPAFGGIMHGYRLATGFAVLLFAGSVVSRDRASLHDVLHDIAVSKGRARE